MMTKQETRKFDQQSRLPRHRRDTCACATAISSTTLPITRIERDSESLDDSCHASFSQQSSAPTATSQQIGRFNPHRPFWAA